MASRETKDASNPWRDRLSTPLNACSLETFTPLPSSPCEIDGSNKESNPPMRDDHVDHVDNYVVPLVIGCYQLNESSSKDDSDNATTGDTSNAPNAPNATIDDNDNHDNEQNEQKDQNEPQKSSSSRSGELRLYMIESPPSSHQSHPSHPSSSNSSSSPGHSNSADSSSPKFGEAACIVEMESGVLDGKWKRIYNIPNMPNDGRNNNNNNNNSSCNNNDSSSSSSEKQKRPLFASACASGRIHIHALEHSIIEPPSNKKSSCSSWHLSHVASSSEEDAISSISSGDSALCLSLAWNDFFHANDETDKTVDQMDQMDQIVSSYSNGTVALHDVISNEDSMTVTIQETHRWEAHAMFGCPSEVWTCSFLGGNEHAVMSGADDCSLKIWDTRQTQRPTLQIAQSEFEAGVTALSSHPFLPHIFAAGSYDEYVRVYDHRKMSQMSQPLWKIHVGGGVWRIKWHPDGYNNSHNSQIGTMLVAAMHGGCRIVDILGLGAYSEHSECSECSEETCLAKDFADVGDVGDVVDGIRIRSEFTEHESMAYGADWVWFGRPGRPNCVDGVEAAASCSFYDRQAFLWDPHVKSNK